MKLIELIVIFGTISALTFARKRLPLKAERSHRRPRNSTECIFGKKVYEIEEKWSPDLGPPFGVMYCIRCECLAVSKKRRIVSRTTCRNIKNECPRPRCKEPRLLPGRCCKSCPGSGRDTIEDDIALSRTEMEASSQDIEEYEALLTGYQMNMPTQSPGSAKARITFHRRNLHYTVYSNNVDKVKAVRFLDHERNIVEEQHVTTNSSKICGVWRKLPRMYRRLLQKEKMSILLVVDEFLEGIVVGPITKTLPIIYTVLFESVLAPDSLSLGAGGMATVSVDRLNVFFLLSFNGLFTNSEARPVVVDVLVEKVKEKEMTRIEVKRSTATISESSTKHEAISIKTTLSSQEMRQLARGKLEISIISQNDNKKISGKITPIQTCDVFQAVLSGKDSFEEIKPSTGAVGMAQFDLNKSGYLQYSVHVMKLSSMLISLKMYALNKDNVPRQLDEILPAYMNGWANGTYSKVTSRDIDSLLRGCILINVRTVDFVSELRGCSRRILHTEVHQKGSPLLLHGNQTSAAGIAWLYVDDHCQLHYDVSTSGLARNEASGGRSSANERHMIELEEIPERSSMKGQRVTLHKFDGIYINSLKRDLGQVTLSRLDSGVTYLKVISKHFAQPLEKGKRQNAIRVIVLKTRINNVKVPEMCLPDASAMGRLSSGDIIQLEQANIVPDSGDMNPKTCYYEGRLFEDGAQWSAEHDRCMMCSCQKRRVVCDPVVCPTLTCHNKMLLPGECCHTCRALNSSNDTSDLNRSSNGCYFEGDRRFHSAGSSWHPYLPPNGFSKCALCTCEYGNLKVKCQKIKCLPLACPEFKAYREHPMSCCKRCPAPRRYAVNLKSGERSRLHDQGSALTVGEILSLGGCKHRKKIYKNGDYWNPVLKPFGTIKTICCHCKDGKRRCSKGSCTVTSSKEDNRSSCADDNSRGCKNSSKRGFRRRKHKRKS